MRTLIGPGLGLVAAMVTQSAAAELKVYPEEGKSVGVVVADVPGKWLVMTVDRETFFFHFPEVELFDGGKVCKWQGAAGVYGVVFDAEDGSRMTTNVVLGGGTVPTDPPGPPDPPTVPEGLWGLTKTAYDQAKLLPAAVSAQIGSVAENYATVAMQIGAGGITTTTAAKLKLKELNRAAVPVGQRVHWDVFDKPLTAILAAHDTELQDVKKVGEAFSAIGEGLIIFLE